MGMQLNSQTLVRSDTTPLATAELVSAGRSQLGYSLPQHVTIAADACMRLIARDGARFSAVVLTLGSLLCLLLHRLLGELGVSSLRAAGEEILPGMPCSQGLSACVASSRAQ